MCEKAVHGTAACKRGRHRSCPARRVHRVSPARCARLTRTARVVLDMWLLLRKCLLNGIKFQIGSKSPEKAWPAAAQRFLGRWGQSEAGSTAGGGGGRGVFGRNESVNERNLAVSAFDRQAP